MKKKHETSLAIGRLNAVETLDYCQDCGARTSFIFDTPNGQERIEVKLLLEALDAARGINDLPNLPQEWWNKVRCTYALNTGIFKS